VTGPTGRTGPTGAPSTVTGPTGNTGPAGSDVYPLPTGGNSWYHLGTLSTAQTGRMFKLEIITQHYYSSNHADFVVAEIVFSTANGVTSQLAFDGLDFYGAASVRFSGWNMSTTSFAIVQNSTSSYAFYFYMLEYPGGGLLRTTRSQAGDTFTYSGLQLAPTGTFINPSYDSRISAGDVGLDRVNNTSDVDKPLSTAATSALALKANLASPTFTGTVNCGTLTSSGTVTAANLRSTGITYSNFGSLSATSTMQTIYNFAGKRGLVLISGVGSISSSIVAIFDNITAAYYLSVIARNGNASSSGFLGTTNAGTMILSVQADASKNIQVSSTVNGTVSWSVILL